MEVTQLFKYLQSLEKLDQMRAMERAQLDTTPPQTIIESDRKVESLQKTSIVSEEFFRLCFYFDKKLAQDFLWELRLCTFYNQVFDNSHIPFDIRVLATLSFLLHGHLEHVMLLDAFKVYSKNTLMRCVPQICEKIVHFLTPSLVRFPYQRADILVNKKSFMQQFGVPGVVGIMDSFYVRCSKIPESSKHIYKNRRGQTSINVQVVCDHKYRFLDVNPRYPGGSSDIYIWKHSHIRHIMQHLYEKDKRSWLIADRGYRLENCVLNPYRNPKTPQQKTVNGVLTDMRGVLDKAVTLLKERFRCLSTLLSFNHEQSANIISACITLHNYLISKGVRIEQNLSYNIAKIRDLPNAHQEDNSCEGQQNREFIRDFLLNNPLQNLIKPEISDCPVFSFSNAVSEAAIRRARSNFHI